MYFYLEKLIENHNFGSIFGSSSQHFLAMRVKSGDIIKITDLQGCLQTIQIQNFNKKDRSFSYQILNTTFNTPTNSKKILYQALPDKVYLEKLLEVIAFADVDEIIFFETVNSPLSKLNLDRLQKILIRSCCLAQRTFLPKLSLQTWSNLFLNSKSENFQNMIWMETKKNLHKSSSELKFFDYKNKNKNINFAIEYPISLIVGPEGGFNDFEKEVLLKTKCLILDLGELVLPAWLAGYTGFQILKY